MARTRYPLKPAKGAYALSYGKNPLTTIVVTGQGTVAKPVPPARVVLNRALKPAPTPVPAPGYSGTI